MTLDSNCSEFPNSSDTISRKMAIDAIRKLYIAEPKINNDYVYDMAIDQADDALRELPSAEPERKKGEWIEFTNTNHTYVCSVCGRMLVNITDGKNTVTKNYPFCHCGADMRGSDA